MLIRKSPEIPYSVVTAKKAYMSRRRFLTTSTRILAGGVGGFLFSKPAVRAAAVKKLSAHHSSFSTSEALTPLPDVTHYNNFY